MPREPILDMMRRTMGNLEFVEHHAQRDGPFEVTQLINFFLGALAHPWETLKVDLFAIPLSSAQAAGWPVPEQQDGRTTPQLLGDLLRFIRNGIAHGNLSFFPDHRGQIQAIGIANYDRGRRTWSGVISVRDMRALLERFVALAEEMDLAARQPKRTA